MNNAVRVTGISDMVSREWLDCLSYRQWQQHDISFVPWFFFEICNDEFFIFFYSHFIKQFFAPIWRKPNTKLKIIFYNIKDQKERQGQNSKQPDP